MSYLVLRSPQLERVEVRGLAFQLYRWPGNNPDPLVMLHGWGDSGATFQFLVDCLSTERTCIAVDLRGFGRSQRPEDGYWFPDYLADLDALLESIAGGDGAVDLLGHSMGGNIAMLYAGIRSQRVRRLVSLEGFGLPRTSADQAPLRYAQWLDQLRRGSRFSIFESYEQLVSVLAARNPRTSPERLEFIARAWGQQRSDGSVELRADPKHKHVNPMLYQREQAEACWRAITAPILMMIGDQSDLARGMRDELDAQRLRAMFRDITLVTVAGAGHMMHHEHPERVAAAIETFLTAER